MYPEPIDNFLSSIDSPQYWPDLDTIQKTYLDWQSRGAEIISLGTSKEGRLIQAAVIGTGEQSALFWGYPHPDEPVGAQALIELGNAVLDKKIKLNYQLVIVLCADPDNVARQQWLRGDGSLLEFIKGSWRPVRIGMEVDYGFPWDHPPFYQPEDYQGRCQDVSVCLNGCTSVTQCLYKDLPYRPLPESKALLAALTDFKPQYVFAMHNTHAAADYTFLLKRFPASKIFTCVNKYGIQRYLGEAVDRGARWKRSEPDLLRERTIDFYTRQLKRLPGYSEGYSYAGNASAANVIESLLPDSQFSCPETALFQHPDFSDTSLTDDYREITFSKEMRRNGESVVARFNLDNQQVIAWQERGREDVPESGLQPAPRGLLGVEALTKRRQVLQRVDKLWEEISHLKTVFHPYVLEREEINTPGAYVGDKSMLIFRTRKDYQQPATKAQAASFAYIYPIHTLTRLSNFYNFLNVQPDSLLKTEVINELNNIVQETIADLPAEMQVEHERSQLIKSQLARVLLLMLDPD